jgi:hypothetical protein
VAGLGKWLTVNKRVENAHGPVADTSVGVNLLEDCDASECTMRWNQVRKQLTLVDVRRVGLLPGFGSLLLLAGRSGRLLARLLLLGGCLASRGLTAGGGSLLGFGRHFW